MLSIRKGIEKLEPFMTYVQDVNYSHYNSLRFFMKNNTFRAEALFVTGLAWPRATRSWVEKARRLDLKNLSGVA